MALKLGSATSERLERILIYGDPKTGKTRLATSLTPRFGDSLYVAWDPGSGGLSSVLESYRSRLRVLSMEYPPGKPLSVDDNPHKDAFVIACQDWVGKPPEEWKGQPPIKTLIWDTMTATSLDLLNWIAASGQFSQGGVSIGKPGGPEHIKLPQQGDYGGTQNAISRLVDFLFKQPLHLIVICHATYDEPREGGSVEGGPATSGKATVRSFPGRFDSVIHLTRRSAPTSAGATVGGSGSTGTVTAWTERHGIWSAGIRSGHATNPLPKLDLDADPVNFWQKYDQVFLNPSKEA